MSRERVETEVEAEAEAEKEEIVVVTALCWIGLVWVGLNWVGLSNGPRSGWNSVRGLKTRRIELVCWDVSNGTRR